MTEVEALLSADAGRIPDGVKVFVAREAEAPVRRAHLAAAVALAATAVGCSLGEAPGALTAFFGLLAGASLVRALPTLPEPGEAPSRRSMLLVTASGVILRDATGLRSWRFEEIKEVRRFMFCGSLGLLLVQRDGRRYFVDNLAFERGEEVGDMIGARLTPERA